MKLRARVTKPEYYNSGDLLKLQRDLRNFYRDLWSISEDSGCFENDPLEICCVLYPSPLDRDITPEKVSGWLKSLEEIGKLISYQANGKEYFWVKNFHKHQKLHDCYPPEIPLPEWITFKFYPSSKEGKVRGNGCYAILEDLLADYSRFTRGLLADYSEITLNQNQNQNQTKPEPLPPSAGGPQAATGVLFSQGEDDLGKEPTLPPNQKTTKTTNKQGDSRIKAAIDHYARQYKEILGLTADVVHGRDEKILKDRLAILDGEKPNDPDGNLERLKGLLEKFLQLEDKFVKDKGYPLTEFARLFNGLRLKQIPANPPRKDEAKSGQSSELFYFNQPGS